MQAIFLRVACYQRRSQTGYLFDKKGIRMSREQHFLFQYNQKEPSTPCEGKQKNQIFFLNAFKRNRSVSSRC